MADPHGTVVLARVGQLEALSSPVRTRILRLSGVPITVAELAERLGVPKTRLYYHVNLLVAEGMLEQVDSRKSGARIERIYLRTAADYQLSPDVARSVGDVRKAAELAASVLLEPARAEIEDSLEQVLSGTKPPGTFGRAMARLSRDDATRFSQRLEELMFDIREAGRSDDESGQLFAITATFSPVEEGEES